jgi:hypothetical protein
MPGLGTTAYNSAGDAFSLIRSMLNDADVPTINTILPPPIGTLRAAGVAFIQTNLNHLLSVGSIVQVGSVSDPSFNGTQVVSAIITPNDFAYNNPGPNVSSGNGVVSLLIQGDVWMDAVLVPFVNKAYRKVQRRLAEAGSKTTTEEAILSLAPGQNALTDSSLPQLPVDFLAPRELWESITGSGAAFTEMSPVDTLPNLSPSSSVPFNRVWAWFNESINFSGASNALDVRIRYFNSLPAISDATSPIAIRGGVDAVASHAAFLAANSRGSPSATMFASQFEEDMKELLNLQAHARQYLPGRRRPNNAGRGRFAGRF